MDDYRKPPRARNQATGKLGAIEFGIRRTRGGRVLDVELERLPQGKRVPVLDGGAALEVEEDLDEAKYVEEKLNSGKSALSRPRASTAASDVGGTEYDSSFEACDDGAKVPYLNLRTDHDSDYDDDFEKDEAKVVEKVSVPAPVVVTSKKESSPRVPVNTLGIKPWETSRVRMREDQELAKKRAEGRKSSRGGFAAIAASQVSSDGKAKRR